MNRARTWREAVADYYNGLPTTPPAAQPAQAPAAQAGTEQVPDLADEPLWLFDLDPGPGDQPEAGSNEWDRR